MADESHLKSLTSLHKRLICKAVSTGCGRASDPAVHKLVLLVTDMAERNIYSLEET